MRIQSPVSPEHWAIAHVSSLRSATLVLRRVPTRTQERGIRTIEYTQWPLYNVALFSAHGREAPRSPHPAQFSVTACGVRRAACYEDLPYVIKTDLQSGFRAGTGSPTIGYANPGYRTRSRHGATSFSMKVEEWIAT